jgi:hypothetical protein
MGNSIRIDCIVGMLMRFLYAACFIVLLAAGAARAEAPPVEAYAALPFQQMRLSPDGSKIAAIIAVGGRERLAVFPIHPLGKPIARGTGDAEPNWFIWKSDETLLVSLRTIEIGSFGPYVRSSLAAISSDFATQKRLKASYGPTHLLSLLPNDPDNILVEARPISAKNLSPTFPSVYRFRTDASGLMLT